MLLALTRTPAAALQSCELTYLARQPIDIEQALQQHGAYCTALEANGVRVIRLPAVEDLPDSVFVEDTALVFDEVAVLTPMGNAARESEPALIAPYLAQFRRVEHIRLPAHLEGGDVLVIDRQVFVGLSPRTNQAGVLALRDILTPYGYEVISVAVTGCLHLKTGCTALDPQTVLINPAWVAASAFSAYRQLIVPAEEEWGANVLRLNDVLIMSAAFPRTKDLVESYGYKVVSVDITEFSKAEAGLSCMSLIFNELTDSSPPD